MIFLYLQLVIFNIFIIFIILFNIYIIFIIILFLILIINSRTHMHDCILV